MSWKQTQAQVAAYDGVGATMMFTEEWVDAGQPGGGDGQSAQAGVDLPTITLDSTEVSLDKSICVSYIYLFFCNNVYII